MSRRAAGIRVAAVFAWVTCLALVCASGVAHAQFTPTGLEDRKATPEMNKRTVRSGLVVALMLGWGVAGSSGYPNDSSQIGNPAYYSSSDVMIGSGSGLFIGGALADYVNFGFFFVGQSYKSHDWNSKGAGAGFRVETFPLVYAVPTLKNLGLFAQFGIGSASLDVSSGNYPEAKGVQSLIGIGGMYEITIFHILGGHGVIGPTLEYDAIYSTSISSGAGLLGGRVAFYGGM